MAKPKLALIPSGYSDGKVFSVLPANGSGDFDFSRGSNATRVNKDGLIETMPLELGSELITNGGFATDSDWTTDASWSISGGSVSCDGTQSSLAYAQQNGAIISGRIYEVTYEIKSISSGEFRVFVGNVSSEPRTSTGVYTDYITASNTSFWLRGSSTFIGSIDNVSVKEVLSGFDTPRLDYSDSSCPSLLLEPQRTNLVTYSEDFSNSSWVKQNVNLTSNYELSPSGLLNADRVITTNTGVDLYQTISVSANTTYTFTFYAKLRDGENIQARFYDLSNSANISYINYSSQLSNNQWKRVEIEVTTPLGCTSLRVWLVALTSTVIDVSYWGAQLEQSSYPTSYIPTNGATVTRLAETASGAGNADTFNDSEGVLMAEISDFGSGINVISLNTGNNTQKIMLYLLDGNKIRYYIQGSGGFFSNDVAVTSTNNFSKILIKYKQNDFSLWVNGFEVDINTSSITFDNLSSIDFYNPYGGGADNFYGNTKQIQYFDTALTDTDLEELTSWESFLDMANGQNYTIK